MWEMGKSMARSPELARCFSSWPWNRPQSMRMPDRDLSPRGLTPMAPDSALPIRSSWQEPVTPFTAPWCKISIISTFLVGLTQIQRKLSKLSRTPSRREYGGCQSRVFIACEQSTVRGALSFRTFHLDTPVINLHSFHVAELSVGGSGLNYISRHRLHDI